MCKFDNQNLCEISYEAVRSAMDGEPFTMSLVWEDATAVMEAVNQGIDSHLETCYMSDYGDSYEKEERRTKSGKVHTVALSCTVSEESLPVLLRRLFEDGDESGIGSDILTSLGFNDIGIFVGREALGLE